MTESVKGKHFVIGSPHTHKFVPQEVMTENDYTIVIPTERRNRIEADKIVLMRCLIFIRHDDSD